MKNDVGSSMGLPAPSTPSLKCEISRIRPDAVTSVTGVFLKRWPGIIPSKKWRPYALLAAKEVRMVETDDGGLRVWHGVVAAIALVGGLLVFLAARVDTRAAGAAQRHRLARQKANREHFRNKIKGQDAPSPPPSGDAPEPSEESG